MNIIRPKQMPSFADALFQGQQFAQQRKANEQAMQMNEQQMKNTKIQEMVNSMNLSDARKKKMLGDFEIAGRFLQQGNQQGAIDFLTKRAVDIRNNKGNPEDTIELVQEIATNPQQAFGKIQALTNAFKPQGQNWQFKDGFLFNPQTGEVKTPDAVNQANLNKQEKEKVSEFRKETRGKVTQGIVELDKKATESARAYKKIENILKKDQLTKVDVSTAITSLARLVAPGIVTEADFRNLTGATDPFAQLLKNLRGSDSEEKAQVADELQKYYDPLNPNLFDRDSFLSTTRNIASGDAQAILEQYDMLKGRSQRAGLSSDFMNTYFPDGKGAYNVLRDLASSKQQPSEDEQALQWARANPNDPRAKEILNNLGGR